LRTVSCSFRAIASPQYSGLNSLPKQLWLSADFHRLGVEIEELGRQSGAFEFFPQFETEINQYKQQLIYKMQGLLKACCKFAESLQQAC
jgi:hypothetical protein